MDRLQTRTDPLLRAESYLYDPNGNLATFTDRKGQVTSRTYDALDRLTQVTDADSSTITYTWDAGHRLTQLTDSLSGTITRTYDLLDRLTQEQTPQGTISYTYDAAGRRTSMTVAGQPPVSYGYDAANRLTSITQGSNVVSYTYDTAGRRASLTLPNGVVTEYTYDAASRLTGLAYKNGPVTLGTLTYGYDGAGNRRQTGGTWARTGLPQPLASATYDAANRPLTVGGASPAHDLNGNLTTDGSTTYTWDARNRLSGLSTSEVTATFQYDAAGRRLGKTLNGTATTVLHNGLDSAQEITGATIRSILTGAGIDEYLSHASISGEPRVALADALGSTIALVDASGAVVTEYTYEPFGTTTTTGASSENRSQYTGRENDGTGLYYYRARYYHPQLQRFISEDPIGFRGGDVNLYAYVRNSPVRSVDPLGLYTVEYTDPDPECILLAGRKDVCGALAAEALSRRCMPARQVVSAIWPSLAD
ncbi:MAG: RHS repeat-associated core domain-containing protein [Candidatus Rokuibacteriota bacterium]